METYTLDIRPDGDYTYIRVPEIDMSTQARTPAEIERMGRDLIATVLDVEPDTFKIIIQDPERIIRGAPANPIMSGHSIRDNRVFIADDWFHITGRGWVATVAASYTDDLIKDGIWDPGMLVNRPQSIDGHTYLVTGVETFRHFISEDSPYRFGFGLLVKGPRIIHERLEKPTQDTAEPTPRRAKFEQEQD